jgi:hypothetical protein
MEYYQKFLDNPLGYLPFGCHPDAPGVPHNVVMADERDRVARIHKVQEEAVQKEMELERKRQEREKEFLRRRKPPLPSNPPPPTEVWQKKHGPQGFFWQHVASGEILFHDPYDPELMKGSAASA